jgi:hypothetical protein
MGAAWVAAYALVLNVILSSALMAAMSPVAFAAGDQICANSADLQTVRDEAGKEAGKTDHKKTAVQCPMCVGNHVAIDLPTPVPAVAGRIALCAPQKFVHGLAPASFAKFSSHQPRGPPHLN